MRLDIQSIIDFGKEIVAPTARIAIAEGEYILIQKVAIPIGQFLFTLGEFGDD